MLNFYSESVNKVVNTVDSVVVLTEFEKVIKNLLGFFVEFFDNI